MSPGMVERWQAWSADAYRYDPEEARRLIAEAYPDGFDFDFWIVHDDEAPEIADVVIACAGYWEEVGAHANIVNVDGAAYKKVRNVQHSSEIVGKFSCKATGVIKPSTVNDLVDMSPGYGSTDFLYGHPDADEFDQLYLDGLTEMDPAKTHDIIDRMIEINTESWTGLPILTASGVWGAGPRVGIYHPMPSAHPAQHYVNFTYTGIEQ